MSADRRLNLFMRKVKVDGRTGCWLWQGHVLESGYGQFWDGERVVGAHVFSYRAHRGPVPRAHDIGNKCGHRACVNPKHLRLRRRRATLLRGKTIPARKAAQIYCLHGHPLSGENLYRARNGTRQCRVCRRDLYREWVNKNRERRRALDRAHYARKRAAGAAQKRRA